MPMTQSIFDVFCPEPGSDYFCELPMSPAFCRGAKRMSRAFLEAGPAKRLHRPASPTTADTFAGLPSPLRRQPPLKQAQPQRPSQRQPQRQAMIELPSVRQGPSAPQCAFPLVASRVKRTSPDPCLPDSNGLQLLNAAPTSASKKLRSAASSFPMGLESPFANELFSNTYTMPRTIEPYINYPMALHSSARRPPSLSESEPEPTNPCRGLIPFKPLDSFNLPSNFQMPVHSRYCGELFF